VAAHSADTPPVLITLGGARGHVSLPVWTKPYSVSHFNTDTIQAIAERAYQPCHPLENIIVDPEWRRAMVPVYVKRALSEFL
jgi:CO/xanthine dehydrogenase FAD-binding subunit